MKNGSIICKNMMKWAKWVAIILISVIIIIWSFIFFLKLFTSPYYYNEAGAFTPTKGAIHAAIFTILLLVGAIIGWWQLLSKKG